MSLVFSIVYSHLDISENESNNESNNGSNNGSNNPEISSVPTNVENTNEEAVALDSIKFVKPMEGVKENLKIIDQALLLALWYGNC
jgi:hypothetical protein